MCMSSAGGGSGGATASSGGHGTSCTPAASATRHAVALGPHRAFGARDAGGEQHRAPVARDALHHAGAPVAQAELHRERVLRAPAPVDHARQGRAHARELPERGPDLVDVVRALSTEPAAALRGVAPPLRHLGGRVGEQRDVKEERGKTGSADPPAAHDTGQQHPARRVTELGPDEVDDARRLGRREHLARLGRVARERLLTKDVFAGRDRFEHEGRVGVRRRRDGDGVDTGAIERVAERCARARDAETRRAVGRLRGIAPCQCTNVEPRGTQRAHVRQAPEPRPDDNDTQPPGHEGSRPRWRPSRASCTDRPRTGSRRARAGRSAGRARPRSRR